MLFDPSEYKQHKGTPDDLNFRRADEQLEERCRKVDKMRQLRIPVSIFTLVIVSLFLYVFYRGIPKDDTIYSRIMIGAVVLFIVLTVISVIKGIIISIGKVEYFEVTEAECVGVIRYKNRTFVSVWCEKEQVYIPKLRYMSVYNIFKEMPLYVVKGDRGEGKKPVYFVISRNQDPLI